MATNFPTSKDTYVDKVDNVDDVIAAHVNNLQDAVVALENKVGITSSADSATLDYAINHASGAMKQHDHDGTDSAKIPGSSLQLLGNTLSGAGILPAANCPIDTDVTLAADSNTKIPTQKAVKTYIDTAISNALSGLISIGAMIVWPTASIPSSFLLCDGSAVSQTTYSALYAVIGTTFNTGGEGAGNFRLPNLNGKTIVGKDSGQTEFDVLGETGGAKTHTLTIAEMPAHTHTMDCYTFDATRYQRMSGYDNNQANGSVATNSTGGGGAHNNLQPYIVLNYIIKYA